MSAMKQRRMTEEEYLAMERDAETKSEYYNGRVVAMAGASWFHNVTHSNLVTQLNIQLKPLGCRAVFSDVKVWSPPTRSYTYPDIAIICGKPEFKDGQSDIILNPKIIFEILSPSTETQDRTLKFQGYISIDSVQEYVLVSQFDPFIQRFVRRSPDSNWEIKPFIDLETDFELVTLPVKIPMAEIYRDVDFQDFGESQL